MKLPKKKKKGGGWIGFDVRSVVHVVYRQPPKQITAVPKSYWPYVWEILNTFFCIAELPDNILIFSKLNSESQIVSLG